MDEMLIDSGSVTFSFKMRKPASAKSVLKMIAAFGDINADVVEADSVSYEQPVEAVLSKPKKPHRVTHRREYNIDGEIMDMFDIAEELYPGKELTRQQKYRKVGGILERDFRLPDGSFDNSSFTKHMTKEIRKARAIKKAANDKFSKRY